MTGNRDSIFFFFCLFKKNWGDSFRTHYFQGLLGLNKMTLNVMKYFHYAFSLIIIHENIIVDKRKINK